MDLRVSYLWQRGLKCFWGSKKSTRRGNHDHVTWLSVLNINKPQQCSRGTLLFMLLGFETHVPVISNQLLTVQSKATVSFTSILTGSSTGLSLAVFGFALYVPVHWPATALVCDRSSREGRSKNCLMLLWLNPSPNPLGIMFFSI